MMLPKLATLSILKTKVFWNQGYGTAISSHDVTDKRLSRDSNYIVVMWPKFGKCSISVWEVIITSILKGFDQKNFLEGYSLFKLNNLGLSLGTAFKLYTNEAKGLKLKVRQFLGLIPTLAEFIDKKMVGGTFWLPILNRVKTKDLRKLGKIRKILKRYRIIT